MICPRYYGLAVLLYLEEPGRFAEKHDIMSYTVSGYALSLARFQELLGSKDHALLDEITAACAEDIGRHNEHFKKEIERGAPPLERALADLIDGASVKEGHGDYYWYGIELLAKHVGSQVDLPGLAGVDSSYLQEVDRILGESLHLPPQLRLTAILPRDPLVSLPLSTAFPVVGFLTASECEQLGIILEGVDFDDLDGDPEILAGVGGYVNLVDKGVAAGDDVLLFYY